jgi:hypothetical protein
MKNFELVRVYLSNDGKEAEVDIRDKNSFLAFTGILKIHNKPREVYPPDYFKEKEKKVYPPGYYSLKIKEKK